MNPARGTPCHDGRVVRGVRVAVVGALALALLPLGAAGALADAAPAALVPDGSAGSSVTAVIRFADGTETIDLAVSADAGGGRIGVILPTPSQATPAVGDPHVLTELEATIAPRRVEQDDWWGRSSAPRAPAPAPRAALANVDMQTIRATDSKKLAAWLEANALVVSDDARATLAAYAAEGWSLTLASFEPPTDTGVVDPLRFEFATDAVVFPMRLWSSSPSSVRFRFYVVGDGRTELRQDTRQARAVNAAQHVVWAGRLAGTPAASLGEYLTVTDVRVDDPALQLTEDISVLPAVADDENIPEVTVYRPVQLGPLPLGWALVVWGAIGLALAGGWIAWRLRPR